MLRRKPTAITITSEDITSFEESRLQKQLQLQQQQRQQQQENKSNQGTSTSSSASNNNNPNNNQPRNTSTFDPNDELKPLPGDKARIVRTRDERIGIGVGVGSGRAG